MKQYINLKIILLIIKDLSSNEYQIKTIGGFLCQEY